MKKKVLILIAVRLKSKRLKNKALLNLYDEPLIIKLTKRLKKAKLCSSIIWCTSKFKTDDRLAILAKKNGIEIFRNDPLDVMKRFILAAVKYKAQNIVRVTGDNPLTDPKVIDYMIQNHLKKKLDYTSCNEIPFGARSEVIRVNALKRCHKMLADPKSSEYMTWMLNKPKFFKVKNLKCLNKNIKRPEISLTVDYLQDFQNLKTIYNNYKGNVPSLDILIKWIDSQKKLLSKLKKKRKVKKPKNINVDFKNKYNEK